MEPKVPRGAAEVVSSIVTKSTEKEDTSKVNIFEIERTDKSCLLILN